MMLMVSALALVLAIGGATLAWFTNAADPVTNTFATGDVAITLHDEFNKEEAKNVIPGDEYNKDVYVTSEGSINTYVRVKLTPAWDKEGLDTNVVKLTLDTTKWIKIGDWYYYKEALTKGGQTTKLLDYVTFNGAAMDNSYQEGEFTIQVEAEAIQATNNAAEAEWKVNTTNWTAISK